MDGLCLTLTTAMAYCNRTSTSDGGSGCTVLRLTPTSSKELLVKVKHSVLWPTCFCSSDVVCSAVGRSELTCAAVEYVTVRPPGGQSCQQFLGQYINQSGGYITNPDALDNCQYCSYRTTDQFLQSNSNIFYSHHWRNFAFMWIYIGFNVRRRRHRFLNPRMANSHLVAQIFAVFAMTYIFRIRGPSNLFRRRSSA
jgi:hypothetical protein